MSNQAQIFPGGERGTILSLTPDVARLFYLNSSRAVVCSLFLSNRLMERSLHFLKHRRTFRDLSFLDYLFFGGLSLIKNKSLKTQGINYVVEIKVW